LVKFLQNDEEIGTLQFPITEVGTTTTASFMIENNSEDNVELIFYSDDGDVNAESYPKRLLPRESQLAKLTFSPSKDRNDPLNTRWGFREIIG
jgi:hypothetical protein